MRDYEFRIFSAKGGVSLIVHSCHLTDSAAIRSARAFAGAAPFEVWRDLERLLPKPARLAKTPLSGAVRLAEQEGQTKLYEFKLSSPRHEPLLFAAAFATDDQAVEHARRLLKRHSEMAGCEIWRGMHLLRQV